MEADRSIYMRFHTTLDKAIQFIRQVYRDELQPNTQITRVEAAFNIAGLTEEIERQDYLDYHIMWLVGLLYGVYDHSPDLYYSRIANILEDLRDVEVKRVQKYI